MPAPQTIERTLEMLQAHVGQQIGLSEWVFIDQERVNAFAHATDDHQFIHTAPDSTQQETQFSGTIAHGFLTLSLCSMFTQNALSPLPRQTMGINYGVDKVRFLAPVYVGSQIRGRIVLKGVRKRAGDHIMRSFTITGEIKGADKPAFVADTLLLTKIETT